MTPAERQWGRRYKYTRPKNIPEYPGLSWKEPHLILAVFEVLVFRWNYITGNPQKPMETSGAIETIFSMIRDEGPSLGSMCISLNYDGVMPTKHSQ